MAELTRIEKGREHESNAVVAQQEEGRSGWIDSSTLSDEMVVSGLDFLLNRSI
jgi:hypothetical protein